MHRRLPSAVRVIGLFLVLAGAAVPDGSAQEGNHILNKQAQLDRFAWWDNRDWAWYKQNIPFFESPDSGIDETYYYRWQLVTEHLVYDEPDTGYVVSEFAGPVGWSSPAGAISCALGLQLGEIRWLRNPRYAEDYAHFWYHAKLDPHPRGYSCWFADAAWGNYLVIGDRDDLLRSLPDMEAQSAGWMQERWNPGERLFAWSGMHDGMELNIESRQTPDDFAGADSFRPTLNSYLYADLTATARAEDLARNGAKAAEYRQRAADLRDRVLARLWDPRRQFFLSRFAHDERKAQHSIKAGTFVYEDGEFAGNPHGRELSGFVPWEFHLPPEGKGYEQAWKTVVDPEVFLAPYGLYTAEKHDPLFEVSDRGCVWSGPNWPYADAQTLLGMANLLDDYQQNVLTRADYFKVFRNYALSQRKDGRPYIAEDQDPQTGRWLQDTPNHSENYCHSSFNDLVITGLVGLRPRADEVVEINPLVPDGWAYFALDDLTYHGYDLSVVWDRDGSRYHVGKGLTVIANGKTIGSSPVLGRLTCPLPGRMASPPIDRPINFAVNHRNALYPLVQATYSAPPTSAENLIDGMSYYFRDHPTDRWTTEGSPNTSDAFQIDFGTARPLQWVTLYLLDDGEGQPVRKPRSVGLQYWNGTDWREVTGRKDPPDGWTGHRANQIAFDPVSTAKLRVTLTPQPGCAVGLTECEAWGHAPLPLPGGALDQNDLALGARASASYTYAPDRADQINDGKIVRGEEPRNRWTAFDSPNPSDWVQLDLSQPKTIGRLQIVWWHDERGIKLPKDYQVQYWTGEQWKEVSSTRGGAAKPQPAGLDELVFDPVKTDRIRITCHHDLPAKSGLTEVMLWSK